MAEDPYYNRVAIQLIRTPAASRQALEAARTMPLPVPPGGLTAISQAKSWSQAVLRAPFHPPKNTPFVAIANEDGLCDVVRALYPAAGLEIEVAQSRHLISIRVQGFRGAGNTPDKKAEAAAAALLNFRAPVSLRAGVPFGVRAEAVAEDAPLNWRDELRWWVNDGEIGFLSIKATGAPRREHINPSEEFNRRWF